MHFAMNAVAQENAAYMKTDLIARWKIEAKKCCTKLQSVVDCVVKPKCCLKDERQTKTPIVQKTSTDSLR